jgi:hypothetical protein
MSSVLIAGLANHVQADGFPRSKADITVGFGVGRIDNEQEDASRGVAITVDYGIRALDSLYFSVRSLGMLGAKYGQDASRLRDFISVMTGVRLVPSIPQRSLDRTISFTALVGLAFENSTPYSNIGFASDNIGVGPVLASGLAWLPLRRRDFSLGAEFLFQLARSGESSSWSNVIGGMLVMKGNLLYMPSSQSMK